MVFRAPLQVLLVSSVVGFTLFGDALIYAALPANVAAFGVGTASVGLLLSANRFVRLFSNSLAGYVYDRFGLRVPLALAVVGAVASTASYGLLTGFWPLLVARALWGICFSFLRLGGFLAVLEESTDLNRGRMMGVFNAIWRSGAAVGVTLGGVLVDVVGVRWTFVLFAGLSAVGLAPILRVRSQRREHPIPVVITPSPESQPVGEQNEERRWQRSVWTVLVADLPSADASRRAPILATSFVRFMTGLALQGLVISTLGYYLRENLGEGLHVLGALVGVTSLTGLLLGGRFFIDIGLSAPLGTLSDRSGRRRAIITVLLILTAITGVLAISPTPTVLLLTLPLMFTVSTAGTVTLDAAVGDLAPVAQRAHVMGRYSTWADLGSALGPLLGFAMLARVQLWALYLAATVLLLATMLVYVAVNRDAQQTQSETATMESN